MIAYVSNHWNLVLYIQLIIILNLNKQIAYTFFYSIIKLFLINLFVIQFELLAIDYDSVPSAGYIQLLRIQLIMRFMYCLIESPGFFHVGQ